jgi:hypothetical protein
VFARDPTSFSEMWQRDAPLDLHLDPKWGCYAFPRSWTNLEFNESGNKTVDAPPSWGIYVSRLREIIVYVGHSDHLQRRLSTSRHAPRILNECPGGNTWFISFNVALLEKLHTIQTSPVLQDDWNTRLKTMVFPPDQPRFSEEGVEEHRRTE